MQWRDMANVVLKTNPNASPQHGVCFVDESGMWTVARVDITDASLGWAVWCGPRRIGEHLHFADDAVARVFARIVSVPIGGMARALRVVLAGRKLVLSAAAGVARLQRLRGVFVKAKTHPAPAETGTEPSGGGPRGPTGSTAWRIAEIDRQITAAEAAGESAAFELQKLVALRAELMGEAGRN